MNGVPKEPSMNGVQVEQKSYEMPPREGFSVAHFLTVADVDRSARFYETVFGGRILSRGDSNGAPGYIQIAKTWLLVNVGGGPTPDKPSVTLSVLPDPEKDQRLHELSASRISRPATSCGKSRRRVHHGAKTQVRRDTPLHPRSRRLHHRGRTEYRPHVRLAVGRTGFGYMFSVNVFKAPRKTMVGERRSPSAKRSALSLSRRL